MELTLTARPVKVSDPTLFYNDSVLVTKGGAFTALEVPFQPYAFMSARDRVRQAWLNTMSLAAVESGRVVITQAQAPAPIAAQSALIDTRVREQGQPTPAWPAYRAGMDARRRAEAPLEPRCFMRVGLGARGGLFRRGEPRAAEVDKWTQAAGIRRGALNAGSLAGIGMDTGSVARWRRWAMTRQRSVLGQERGAVELGDEFADVEVVPGPAWVMVDSSEGRRYCATFVCSQFPVRMSLPDQVDPWLGAHLARIDGFPIDSELVLDLVPPEKALSGVSLKGKTAIDQIRDAQRADIAPTLDVREMAALAEELEYTIPRTATPAAYGWALIRVDADSPAELSAMFREVRRHMRLVGSTGIEVVRPLGDAQVALHLGAVPGMDLSYGSAIFGSKSMRSWYQRSALETQACAGQWTGRVPGHAAGRLRGFLTGRRRGAVLIDLHAPITRRVDSDIERQGGVALLGAQRSGKSSALTQIIVDATIAGSPWVWALDPAGPLARNIPRVPECGGRAEGLDLLSIGGGVIDPLGPVLVPGDATKDERVRQMRFRLASEMFQLLAYRHLSGFEGGTAQAELLRAINRVSRSRESCSAAMLADLARSGEPAARNLGSTLGFELDIEGSSVLLGQGAHGLTRRAVTTRILSMSGMILPPAEKSMPDWTTAERLGAATFLGGSFLLRNEMFSMNPNILKIFVVDEAHVLLATAEGRRLVADTLRQGPKYGIISALATHNAADLLHEAFTAAIAQWFLFRTESPTELAASFERSGLADTVPHRDERRGLRNGECITVIDGIPDRFQWDLWLPSAAAAAKTTPTGRMQ